MKKGIVISCVDPRLHHTCPDIESLMGVDQAYVHRIPGPNGVFVNEHLAQEKAGIVACVRRLSGLADISAYALVGHTTCAGHNVTDEEHREHTVAAARNLKDELGITVPVYAILTIRGKHDADWHHEVLATV